MKKKNRRILFALGLICAALFFTACTNEQSSFATGQYYHPTQGTEAVTEPLEETTEQAQEAQETVSGDLFLITKNDMQEECIILEQLASGKQYMYYYSVTTQFLDKYGNRAAVSEFTPGRVMTVGKKDIDGRLMQAQLSDAVWEYPDVTRYAIDEERRVFTIADTNYSYDEGLFIYSDGHTLRMSDLTGNDTLDVVGIGKKILSVSVATGHGALQLENTSLFDGSFIQVGNKIFSEITPEMKLEVPEGVYTVAVANKGYGGSTEVEIRRGQTTVLDLEQLKGEGPKKGNILFAVDVADAVLKIDGETVDYSKPVPVEYGVHTLTVTADSYDPYVKKLFVNSPEATIVIGLSSDGEGVSGTDATQNNANGETAPDTENGTAGGNGQAGSLAGGLAGSHSSGMGSSPSDQNGQSSQNSQSSQSGQGAVSDAELDAIVNSILGEESNSSKTDYLSTLTELLSALTEAK